MELSLVGDRVYAAECIQKKRVRRVSIGCVYACVCAFVCVYVNCGGGTSTCVCMCVCMCVCVCVCYCAGGVCVC